MDDKEKGGADTGSSASSGENVPQGGFNLEELSLVTPKAADFADPADGEAASPPQEEPQMPEILLVSPLPPQETEPETGETAPPLREVPREPEIRPAEPPPPLKISRRDHCASRYSLCSESLNCEGVMPVSCLKTVLKY